MESGNGLQPVVFSLPDERWSLRKHGQAPVESAEHRRLKRGCRRGLFEQQTEGLMRVPQPPFQTRSTGNPQPQAEGANVGSPSLGYFSWRDKKSNVPAGHPRHLKIARKRTKQIARLCARNPEPRKGTLRF